MMPLKNNPIHLDEPIAPQRAQVGAEGKTESKRRKQKGESGIFRLQLSDLRSPCAAAGGVAGAFAGES